MSAIVSHSLLQFFTSQDVLAKKVDPLFIHWSKQLNDWCLDLKKEQISQAVWQQHAEALFREIPMKELLQFIDFDKLIKNFTYPDLGVGTKYVRFPKLEGIPQDTVFIKKIFGLKKDRAIIPHGHSNMASAHVVLKGDFSLKHYDKVAEDKQHLFIRPTIDHHITQGDCSSISDEEDNVHWFIAKSDYAFTLDIIMLNLNNQPYDIHNIDILASEKVHGDQLRVPKLDVQTALKKYGKLNHH